MKVTILTISVLFGAVSCLVGKQPNHAKTQRKDVVDTNTHALHRLCKEADVLEKFKKYKFEQPEGYIHAYDWQHPNWDNSDDYYRQQSRANSMKYMLTGVRPAGESIGLRYSIKLEGNFYTWYNESSNKSIGMNGLAIAWLKNHAKCTGGLHYGFPVLEINDLELFSTAGKDHTWLFIGLADGSMTFVATRDPKHNNCTVKGAVEGKNYVCWTALVIRFNASGKGHEDFYSYDKKVKIYKIIQGKWFDKS